MGTRSTPDLILPLDLLFHNMYIEEKRGNNNAKKIQTRENN